MPRRLSNRAFTLIEILVVVGIIAVLLAILLPTVSRARAVSKRTKCAAHLRDVGAQFQMYLNDSKSKLPRVNTMPSIVPPLSPGPSLVELLEPYHKGAKGVFECPADAIKEVEPAAPAGFERYFDRETSSFLYNPRLSAEYFGRTIPDAFRDMERRSLPKNFLYVIREYEPFHGKPGALGSMNYLFADMHVGDLID
jgi:prepilin-type N-terminal cleavage/methylation domain-containing protein